MRYFLPLLLLALAGAGCGPPTAGPEVLGTRTVKLPNGQEIRAEVEMTPEEMQKGMMFRDSPAAKACSTSTKRPASTPIGCTR